MVSYLWDFLRPFTGLAYEFDYAVKWIVFLFSIALFAISLMAYLKKKKEKKDFKAIGRLMFVTLAFFFFVLKWGLKIVDLYFSPGIFLADASENIFELLIFISLFVALFKK